jgi:hypothetical protein
MQKFRVRYGCMLLCAWLAPVGTTVSSAIGTIGGGSGGSGGCWGGGT